MANVQKFSSGASGHIGLHLERGLNENGEIVKYGNQEIDIELSHLNYNLAPDHGLTHPEFIKKRTSEVKCLKRKDVKVMVNWVVTLPKGLNFSEQQQQEFFQESYNFLKERYCKAEVGGDKNIISSYVHLDENQPHMHFSFIPITKDKKKGHLKVSAKEVVTRIDLKSFHKDLSEHLERHFGRDIGILNESTKEGNLNIAELKRKSASKQLLELEDIELRLTALKSEYEAKKAYIENAVKSSELSMMYPNWAEKKEKGIFKKESFVTVPAKKWEDKHISFNERNAIVKEREKLEREIEKFQKSLIGQKNSNLKKIIKSISEENSKLKKELQTANNYLARAERTLRADPELEKKFFETDKIINNSSRNKNLGRTR